MLFHFSNLNLILKSVKYDCRADDQLLVESSWWQDRYNVSRLFSHCIHKAEANSVCSIILCPEFNNSNLVPITGLNFGAAKQMNNVTENLEIRFTLGQLTCSGSVNEKRVEDSRIGGRSYPICPNDIGPDSKCFATLTGCYCINQVKVGCLIVDQEMLTDRFDRSAKLD
jgi:hypothetical protein